MENFLANCPPPRPIRFSRSCAKPGHIRDPPIRLQIFSAPRKAILSRRPSTPGSGRRQGPDEAAAHPDSTRIGSRLSDHMENDHDVLIIGSGASGGMVAHTLT